MYIYIYIHIYIYTHTWICMIQHRPNSYWTSFEIADINLSTFQEWGPTVYETSPSVTTYKVLPQLGTAPWTIPATSWYSHDISIEIPFDGEIAIQKPWEIPFKTYTRWWNPTQSHSIPWTCLLKRKTWKQPVPNTTGQRCKTPWILSIPSTFPSSREKRCIPRSQKKRGKDCLSSCILTMFSSYIYLIAYTYIYIIRHTIWHYYVLLDYTKSNYILL